MLWQFWELDAGRGEFEAENVEQLIPSTMDLPDVQDFTHTLQVTGEGRSQDSLRALPHDLPKSLRNNSGKQKPVYNPETWAHHLLGATSNNGNISF